MSETLCCGQFPCVRKVPCEQRLQRVAGLPRPYRPSNGTEGESFHEAFCYRCLRFEECNILDRAIAYLPGQPEFPTEWICGPDGPCCTAFENETDDPELAAARADPRQGSLPI